MSISDLPDNCLMYIFEHFNHMHDLEKTRIVCVRWKELVEIILKRIRNAICYDNGPLGQNAISYKGPSFPPLPYKIARQTVYIKIEYEEKKFRCIPSHLIPNLELIDFSYIKSSELSRKKNERLIGRFLEAVIRNPEKITGLSLPPGSEALANHFKNLSIYSSEVLGSYGSHFPGGSKLKQLYLVHSSARGPFSAKHQNLELLKTAINIDTYARFWMPNHQTIFAKLETLIILFYSDYNTRHGLRTIDLVKVFPMAKNVCLQIEGNLFQELTFSGLHLSVQTLVLDFERVAWTKKLQCHDKFWDNLASMLQLYPNIKHLAIVTECHLLEMNDSRLLKLLERLPNLVLLKLKDHEPSSLKRVVEEFNSQTGRSIKFMYNKQTDASFTEFTTVKNNDFMRKYFGCLWLELDEVSHIVE